MKLCANINMLFTEQPLLDRFALAAQAGFSGVEILNPYECPAADLAAAASRAGVTIALINAPMGNIRGGERGFACDPDAADHFRTGLLRALQYAEQLGVARINLLPGKCLPGDDRNQLLQTYADNLRWAADLATTHGIRIDVEALNEKDIPGSLLPTQMDAFELLQQLNHPSLDLQFDYYHCLKANQDPVLEYKKCRSRVGHVQFADQENRCQPSREDRGFAVFVGLLKSTGYQGWFSAEYRPEPSSVQSLGWMKLLEEAQNNRG